MSNYCPPEKNVIKRKLQESRKDANTRVRTFQPDLDAEHVVSGLISQKSTTLDMLTHSLSRANYLKLARGIKSMMARPAEEILGNILRVDTIFHVRLSCSLTAVFASNLTFVPSSPCGLYHDLHDDECQ